LEEEVKLTFDKLIVYLTTVTLSFSRTNLCEFLFRKKKWVWFFCYLFFFVSLAFFLETAKLKHPQNFHQRIKSCKFVKVLFYLAVDHDNCQANTRGNAKLICCCVTPFSRLYNFIDSPIDITVAKY